MLQGICPSGIQACFPKEQYEYTGNEVQNYQTAFRSCRTWPLVYLSFYYVSRCLPSLRLPFCFALGIPGCPNYLFWVCLNIFVSEVWILDLCFSTTGSERWTWQFPFLQPWHHVPTFCQIQFPVWSLLPCSSRWLVSLSHFSSTRINITLSVTFCTFQSVIISVDGCFSPARSHSCSVPNKYRGLY